VVLPLARRRLKTCCPILESTEAKLRREGSHSGAL